MSNPISRHTTTKSRWSSRIHFILATTGAAVGLGNIWKFPYMAGNHGGGLFVFLYLICVLLIGLPLMAGEMLIGLCARANPMTSLEQLAKSQKKSTHWRFVGLLGSITLLFVLSFYSVIAGWSLAYLYYAIIGKLQGITTHGVTALWQHLQANISLLTICHAAFMSMTLIVVSKGIQAGIEKACAWMMPALFVILLFLVTYAAINSHFLDAVHFLFDLHWKALNINTVIDALGQAFFSLAIGAGCMLTYAAYLPSRVSIAPTISIITCLNILVALLTGLAIFPWVFQYHLSPQSGPGLMFQTLPMAFSHMPFGSLLATCFFILLLFAAWTSSISLAEPLVALLIQRFHYSRLLASCLVGMTAWILGLASLFSFNIAKNINLFGQWTFFDLITGLSTNILLPIGGVFLAIFSGWCLPSIFRKKLGLPIYLEKLWTILIRYAVPLGIILTLFNALT